jgi:ATP-dependent RNA helicase DDX3X
MTCHPHNTVVLKNTLIELVSSISFSSNKMLTALGRTGRIGNMGLATSFYTERDADLGEALVKTLLETSQVIPDFLESLLPEGFTVDGGGDISKLKFEADSDFGDDENAEPASAGWGENPSSAEPAVWGAVPAVQVEQSNVGAVSQPDNTWGAQPPVVSQPVAVPQPANTWGAQPVISQPSPVRPAPAMNSWSVPAAPAQAPAPTTSGSGWGAPAAPAQAPAATNSASGWGSNGGSTEWKNGAAGW